MKQFATINEIMVYMLEKHGFVGKNRSGGYGIVTFRKADGNRNIVQEMRYFRIFKYDIYDGDTLLLHNIITGLAFKGKEIRSASSILYLPELLQINVYDQGSHFYTDSGIDFGYVLDEKSVTIKMMRAWIDDTAPVMRAQWRTPNRLVDDFLDELTFGRKVVRVTKGKRNIDIKHSAL